jgi:hypothetical protein
MRFWVVLVCLCSLSARVHAQEAYEAPAEPRELTPPPVLRESEPSPQSPLAWWWQHSTPVPIVFYAPENQLGLGGGVMTTWPMEGSLTDRPSNVTLYGIYTTRKQVIFGGSYELRFREDRHVWWQEFRYIDWPDRFYGIGNATRERDLEGYTDYYQQLESEYQHRAVSHLYVGLRHLLRASHTRDLETDGALATRRPHGTGKVLWSGAGPVLVWDSREGLFWPTRGSLLRADATIHTHALGADFSAALLRLDLRHYQPLWFGHVLALRFASFGVLGHAPFQLLPALGGSTLFRGWYLGRLRDRMFVAAEAEYRAALSRRWAVVAFGSLGRVASGFDDLHPRGLHGAGGAGIRFAVRPESRANFRFDLAYGDELYPYFQFREAF